MDLRISQNSQNCQYLCISQYVNLISLEKTIGGRRYRLKHKEDIILSQYKAILCIQRYVKITYKTPREMWILTKTYEEIVDFLGILQP